MRSSPPAAINKQIHDLKCIIDELVKKINSICPTCIGKLSFSIVGNVLFLRHGSEVVTKISLPSPDLNVEFRTENGVLQYQINNNGWINLFDFNSITAKEVELSVQENTLSWRYIGDDTWTPLYDLTNLEGVTLTQLMTILQDYQFALNGNEFQVVLGNGTYMNISDMPISTEVQNILNLKANDEDVVHKTGDETISGIKTFNQSPVVPHATNNSQAINLEQLIQKIDEISNPLIPGTGLLGLPYNGRFLRIFDIDFGTGVNQVARGNHNHSFNSLIGVDINNAQTGDFLIYSGSSWTSYTPNFLTTETDPTVPSWVKEITQEDINKWNNYTTHDPITLSGENYIELINQHLTVKKIDLVSHTVGNLPISRGGTGMSTVGTAGQVLRSNGSSLEYYTLPNYLTTETDPTVPAHVKSISVTDINNWNEAYSKAHDPVTLTGEDYLSLNGQEITVGLINLSSHTTGILSTSKGGTGLSSIGSSGQLLRSNGSSLEYWTPNFLVTETDPTVPSHVKAISVGDIDRWDEAYDNIHDPVTLAGHNYLTISGQQITAGNINLSSHTSGILPVVRGGTGMSSVGSAGAILRSTGSSLEYWVPNYLTTESDPTVPSWVKDITTTDIDNWNEAFDSIHDPVTLTGETYLTISNQLITVGKVNISSHTIGTLPVSRGGTGLTSVGSNGQLLRSDGTGLEYWTPNYITSETDPTVPSYVKAITTNDIDNWNEAYNKSHDLVTLTGYNYLSISGQQISAGNINLSTHTSGILPITKGGTGLSFIGGAGTILRSTGSELEYWMPDYIVTETDPTVPSWVKGITSTDIDNWNNAFNSIHSPVTLIGEGYLTISNQQITVGKINIVDHTVGTLSVARGGTGLTTIGTNGQLLRSTGSALEYWTPNFLTVETDPTVPSYVKAITTTDIDNWNQAYSNIHDEVTLIGETYLSIDNQEITVGKIDFPTQTVGIVSISRGGTGLTSVGTSGQLLRSNGSILEYWTPNFLTVESDPTVPAHVKAITTTDIDNWNNAYSSIHDPVTLSGLNYLSLNDQEIVVGSVHITNHTTGTLSIVRGGTGLTTIGTSGQLLRSNGSTLEYWTPDFLVSESDPTVPSWVKTITITDIDNWNDAFNAIHDEVSLIGETYLTISNQQITVNKVALVSQTTGTLTIARGGTGLTTVGTAGQLLRSDGSVLEYWTPDFLTTETDPTVPAHVKAITSGDIDNWNDAFNAIHSPVTIIGYDYLSITDQEIIAGNIHLVNHTTGVLPFTKGGTGLTFIGSAGQLLRSNGTSLEYWTPNYLTTETDPTVPSWVKNITTTDIENWDDAFDNIHDEVTLSGENYLSISGQEITAGILNFSTHTTGVVEISRGGTGLTTVGATGQLLRSNGSILEYWTPNFLTTETDPTVPSHVKAITLVDIGNWDDAFDAIHDAVTITGLSYLSLTGQQITVNAINLASHVTGILPIANGGTGLSSVGTNGQLLRSNGTSLEYWTPNYLTANQTITLTGDVTGSGTTSITTVIPNGTITFSKIQSITAKRLLGRYANTNGAVQEISIGTGLSLSNAGVLSSTVSITEGTGIIVTPDPITSSGSVAFDTTWGDARYLRKDVDDNNDINKLILGELESGDALFNGTVIMSNLLTGTENDVLIIDNNGVIKKKTLSIIGEFGIADASGTNQFNVSLGTDLRFEGSGDTSIAFNPVTNTIIITSIPGSGTGGAVTSFNGRTGAVIPQSGDYTTSIVSEGTNLYFTEARVLSTILAGYTLGTNTAITATDNVLQAFGKIQAQINGRVPTGRTLTINGTSGRISVSGGTQTLSANRTWTVDLIATGVSADTYTKVEVDVYGRVIDGGHLEVTDIPNLPASIITSGIFDVERLGTGSPSSSTYLAGDGSWTLFPAIPVVNDGVLTLATGTGLTGSQTFSANQSTNATFTVGLNTNLSNLNALTTSGFIKKTGTNTWTVDTNTYLTSVALSDLTDVDFSTLSSGQVLSYDGSNWVNSTLSIPVVNDGTLTLNVGSGLSGSATFTANQSTNTTFTVSLGTNLSNLNDLVGTGILTKTGTNTWALDTSTYLTGNEVITLSGDVIGSGSTSIVTTFRNSTALSVIGRSTNSSGTPDDIVAGTSGHVLRRSGNSLGFGTIGDSSISSLSWSKLTSIPTTLAGFGIQAEADGRYVNVTGDTMTGPLTMDASLYMNGRIFMNGYDIVLEPTAVTNTYLSFVNPNGTSFPESYIILASPDTYQWYSVGGNLDLSFDSLTWNSNVLATQDWVESQGYLTSVVGFVPDTRVVTAGNGLTGGGQLNNNITITMGTPGAITLSSTNSVTSTSHTHEFLPGGTAAQYIRGDGSLATFPTIPGTPSLNDVLGVGNIGEYNVILKTTVSDLDRALSIQDYDSLGSIEIGLANQSTPYIDFANSTNNATLSYNSAGDLSFSGTGGGQIKVFVDPISDEDLARKLYVDVEIATRVPTSRTITAGNGLTGGGNLTANRTITLGTPGAITLSSTNSVSTNSHTHAFLPGGTASQYIRGDGTLETFPSIPVVNDGVLTLSTGDGLTGSASFSANQSGNSTFTVGLSQMTSTVIGGARLFSNTVQSVAANAVSNVVSRTYGIQANASGQLVVNIPWVDTTYTAGTGISIIEGVITNTSPNVVQTLSISGTTVTLSNGGGSIEVPRTRLRGTTSGSYVTGDITLLAGSNVSINQSTNNITINATDTTYTAGDGITLTGTVFSLPITVSGSGNYVSDVTQNSNGITITKNTLPVYVDAILTISRNGINIPIVSQNVDIPLFDNTGAGLVPARVGSTTTKFLREDGQWIVPTNTTYTNMSAAELNTGTATNGRVISAKTLNDWINGKGFTTNTGTVTSVGATISGALTVTGSPITTSGTLVFSWTGDDTQMVLGDGTLTSLPVINDGVLTLGVGAGLTGSSSFSANQSTNSTFTVGLDTNLSNLNALSSTGFVKKTGTNTWEIDEQVYLTEEVDPTVPLHVKGITTIDITNWNNAYGNLHNPITLDGEDYLSISNQVLTAELINLDTHTTGVLPISKGGTNLTTVGTSGQLLRSNGTELEYWTPNYLTSETDPTVPNHVKGITSGDITNWNTAYGWGNYRQYGLGSFNYNSGWEYTDLDVLAVGNAWPTSFIATNLSNPPGNKTGFTYPFGIHINSGSNIRGDLIISHGANRMAFRSNGRPFTEVLTEDNILSIGSGLFVNTTGNQSGIAGNKQWTGRQQWTFPANAGLVSEARSIQVAAGGNGPYVVGFDNNGDQAFTLRTYASANIQLALNAGGISTSNHGTSANWYSAYTSLPNYVLKAGDSMSGNLQFSWGSGIRYGGGQAGTGGYIFGSSQAGANAAGYGVWMAHNAFLTSDGAFIQPRGTLPSKLFTVNNHRGFQFLTADSTGTHGSEITLVPLVTISASGQTTIANLSGTGNGIVGVNSSGILYRRSDSDFLQTLSLGSNSGDIAISSGNSVRLDSIYRKVVASGESVGTWMTNQTQGVIPFGKGGPDDLGTSIGGFAFKRLTGASGSGSFGIYRENSYDAKLKYFIGTSVSGDYTPHTFASEEWTASNYYSKTESDGRYLSALTVNGENYLTIDSGSKTLMAGAINLNSTHTSGVLPLTKGGTGLATIGTDNQILRVNSGVLEYWTPNFLTENETISLSGDVTGSGTTSIVTTIANSVVTYAKIQNVTSKRILGRYATTSGVVQEISIGNGLNLSNDGVLSSTMSITVGTGLSSTPDPITSTGTISFDTTWGDSRYLRKDADDDNDINVLTLGKLISGDATFNGSVTIPNLSTGTSDDIIVIGSGGVLQKKTLTITGEFGIANAAGTNQFNIDLGTDLRFEGAGDTSISFNPVTKTVIINSIPGSGTGGAVTSFNSRTGAVIPEIGDYTTTIVTEGTNLYFTEARVLSTVLTGWTVGTNSTIANTDTILQALGKVQGQINARVPNTRSITINGTNGRIVSTGGTQTLSSNRTWTIDLATSGVSAGTYTKIEVDVYGRAISGSNLTESDIPNLSTSKITTGVFDVARLGTGSASSSTYLRGDGVWTSFPSIPTNYVTTNTNQTGLSGNKSWTGRHTWNLSSTTAPVAGAATIQTARDATGIYLTGYDLDANQAFIFRTGEASGIQLALLKGGISTPSHGTSADWYQAYEWGDHALAGYAMSDVQIIPGIGLAGGGPISDDVEISLGNNLLNLNNLTTSGFVKKTGTDTWEIDTNTYLTSNEPITLSGAIIGTGTTTITTTFRNSAGLSVLGRSANTSGTPDDIVASTNGHVLRRSGTTLGFGTIGDSSITSLSWSKLTSVPTTLAGYGIQTEADGRYVNASGDTMSGSLTMNASLYMNGYSIEMSPSPLGYYLSFNNPLGGSAYIRQTGDILHFYAAGYTGDETLDFGFVNITHNGEPIATHDWVTSQGYLTSVSGYVPDTTQVIAGNGLTGGGTLSSNITLTLGTPGAITLSSSNSVSANSHTHELVLGGTSSQYLRGDGTLATFPTIPGTPTLQQVLTTGNTAVDKNIILESSSVENKFQTGNVGLVGYVKMYSNANTGTLGIEFNSVAGGGPQVISPVYGSSALTLNSGQQFRVQQDPIHNNDLTRKSYVDNLVSSSTHPALTLTGQNYLSLNAATQALTVNAINLSGSHVTSVLPVGKGGTGLSSIGTAGQFLRVNGAGNALEYYSLPSPTIPDLQAVTDQGAVTSNNITVEKAGPTSSIIVRESTSGAESVMGAYSSGAEIGAIHTTFAVGFLASPSNASLNFTNFASFDQWSLQYISNSVATLGVGDQLRVQQDPVHANDLARKSYVDNKFSSVSIPNLQAVTDEGYITNNPINSKKTGGTWISADDDTGYAALNGSDEYSSIALRTVYGYASLSSSGTYTSLSLSKNDTFWVLSTEGGGIATLDSGNQLRVKQDPVHNNDLTRKAYVDNLVKDGTLTLSTGDGLTGSALFSANQSTNSTFTVGLGVNLANLNALNTNGFVKKTGANTWTIDTSTYLTSVALGDLTNVTLSSPANGQILTYNGSAWVNSTPSYLPSSNKYVSVFNNGATTDVVASLDFDDAPMSTILRAEPAVNSPEGSGLLYTFGDSVTRAFQMFQGHGYNDSFWYRTRLSAANGWRGWLQVASRSWVSSTHVQKSGDTMTGTLYGTRIVLNDQFEVTNPTAPNHKIWLVATPDYTRLNMGYGSHITFQLHVVENGTTYFVHNIGSGSEQRIVFDSNKNITFNVADRIQVNGDVRYSGQLVSTVATGTAPMSVTSTTQVNNLNADLLDGQHGSYYLSVENANNRYMSISNDYGGSSSSYTGIDLNDIVRTSTTYHSSAINHPTGFNYGHVTTFRYGGHRAQLFLASDMTDAFYYRQKHDANSTYSPWRQVASREWVTSQNYALASAIPTNYVTTNTNQTGLGGNKTWTGHHIIAPGNTSSPNSVANSVRISRNSNGAFVTIENSSAISALTLRSWSGGTDNKYQISLLTGGVETGNHGNSENWYTAWQRINPTNLGRTGNGVVANNTTLNSEQAWSDLPIGYSAFVYSNVGVANGAPSDTYGYFTKVANRDVGGGWGGLWIDYVYNAFYIGKAHSNTTFATWTRVLTPYTPTTLSSGQLLRWDGTGWTNWTPNFVSSSATISAGNGLTGGGVVSANPTITLGTPGNITLSSSNSVSTNSHTHAFVPGGTTSQYIRGDGSLATFPSIPSVNNGTLTLNTSGSGLSGSASFSANQSGNSTFTVSVAPGYTIPNNDQISHFEQAYGWGNHASAGYVQTSRQVNTSGSLQGGGNLGSNRTLSLVNDSGSPGGNKYYGTNSAGVKGFYDLPSPGGGGTLTGSGSSGYISKWSGGTSLNNSEIYQDGSGNIGIGTTNTDGNKLYVWGNFRVSHGIYASQNIQTGSSFYGSSAILSGSLDVAGSASRIGGGSSATCAVLTLNSTSKGLLVPRMTRTQRVSIPSPEPGLIVFQTDTSGGDEQGFWGYLAGGQGWRRFNFQ